MYKKILAGKLDDLRAELAAEKAAEEGKQQNSQMEKAVQKRETEIPTVQKCPIFPAE